MPTVRRGAPGVLLITVAIGSIVAVNPATAGEHRLGGGLRYLRNLADIEDDPNIEWGSNSFGIIGSYQYSGGLLKLEGDVEYTFDYAGSGETMWIPSGWLLAGKLIYGGAGIGIGHINGGWQTNPGWSENGLLS